ncbi:MAG: hypothetical protein K0Q56_910 [Sporolactobacillus laevolacticus]|jgi:predicted nucleic acid-binding protein|nr:hypothetical protein [Sporolactobacillus laevolacticus]
MFHVFLDTNIIVSDFKFNSQAIRDLLKRARRNDINLCMTEINYREILKKFNDKLLESLNDIRKGNTNLKKFFGHALLTNDTNKIADDYKREYKRFLDEVINDNNIKIVEHSDNILNRFLDRYFELRKPFSLRRNSFQDALIWETIVEYYQNNLVSESDYVFLITDNYKDFADEGSDKAKLHPDLIEDTPCLILYRNAKEFLEKEKDQLKNYILENYELNIEETTKLLEVYFEDNPKVQDEVDYFLLNQTVRGDYYEGWAEDAILRLSEIYIEDYSKDLDSGDVEVNVYLYYDAEYSVVTNNPLYERGDSDDDEFLRDDQGTSQIQVTCNVVVTGEGEENDYSEDNKEIKTFSVEEIQFI